MISDLARRAAFAVATTAAFAGAAFAQESPRSGDVTVFWAHVNATPFAPVTIGDGRIAVVGTFNTATFNQAGSGFMHNMRARCVALQTIDPTAARLEVTGYCEYKDADNDYVYATFGSTEPTPIAGIRTSGELVSGTGKYAGITGTLTISPYNQTTTPEGYVQFLGQMDVSYRLP